MQLSSNIQQKVHELIDSLAVRITNHRDASINEKENVCPQVHPHGQGKKLRRDKPSLPNKGNKGEETGVKEKKEVDVKAGGEKN